MRKATKKDILNILLFALGSLPILLCLGYGFLLIPFWFLEHQTESPLGIYFAWLRRIAPDNHIYLTLNIAIVSVWTSLFIVLFNKSRGDRTIKKLNSPN
ncbi:MAG: hypothetical protein ACQKBV_05725 [Puniceicoccales bacterium]